METEYRNPDLWYMFIWGDSIDSKYGCQNETKLPVLCNDKDQKWWMKH